MGTVPTSNFFDISALPSAPINIDYEIMGKPVVGIPLSINVKISSGLDQPIRVNYRINDTTSLIFSDAQSETVSLVPVGDDAYSSEQVTVIPQREGRLFLNVSAEIETDIGNVVPIGTTFPICSNSQFDNGRDGNKLSEYRYLTLDVNPPSALTFTVNNQNPSTPSVGFDCTADPDDPENIRLVVSLMR